MTPSLPSFESLPFTSAQELFDAWKNGTHKFWFVRKEQPNYPDGAYPVISMSLTEDRVRVWDQHSNKGDSFWCNGSSCKFLDEAEIFLSIVDPTKPEASDASMPSDLDGIARVAALPKAAPPKPPAPPSKIKPAISGLGVVANPDKRQRWGL